MIITVPDYLIPSVRARHAFVLFAQNILIPLQLQELPVAIGGGDGMRRGGGDSCCLFLCGTPKLHKEGKCSKHVCPFS